MEKLFLMTMKLTHSYVILHPLGDEPGHNRARLGGAWLIRELGLNTLMNNRNGGAGRPPFYDVIGAVFVLVAIITHLVSDKIPLVLAIPFSD